MMDANGLLEKSLDELAAKLDALAADHSQQLQPIRDAIMHIEERGGMTAESFIRDLMELSGMVIQVRTQAASPALRDLPVPPYDLWLPFKAEDLTRSDRVDLPGAIRIYNQMVDKCDFRSRSADQASIIAGHDKEIGGKTSTARGEA